MSAVPRELACLPFNWQTVAPEDWPYLMDLAGIVLTREEVTASLAPVLESLRHRVRALCRKKLGARFSSDDHEAVFSETLRAFAQPRRVPWQAARPIVEDPESVVAYAMSAARNVVRDMITSSKDRGASLFSDTVEAPDGTRRQVFGALDELDIHDPPASDEDALIRQIDRRRRNAYAGARGYALAELLDDEDDEMSVRASLFYSDRDIGGAHPFGPGIPLTATFEREEFWTRLRALAANSVSGGEPARRARERILAFPSCPPDLELTTSTSPHDILERYRKQETSRDHHRRKLRRATGLSLPSGTSQLGGENVH